VAGRPNRDSACWHRARHAQPLIRQGGNDHAESSV
jgi:hypothetical protein